MTKSFASMYVLLAVFLAVVVAGMYAFPAVKEGFAFGFGKDGCTDWWGCCQSGANNKIFRWAKNKTCGACKC